ncbi:MAG: hypothetical protein AB1632_00115 [Nitrospirota bacterium]
MLIIVIFLFIYISWNFYLKAVRYDPLKDLGIKTAGTNETGIINVTSYKPGWSGDIYEKNLFSPFRSYAEPRPVLPSDIPLPPPRKPELALKGIVLNQFGEYVAYLEIDKSKPMPMRKGDKIEGVELFDISERKVMIKWNAETINLSLDKIKTISNPRTTR